MQMLWFKSLVLCCTALALSACEQDNNDDGDSGAGGSGGIAVDRGIDASGGVGGSVSCADATPAQCDALDECVQDGDACVPVTDADCSLLDEPTCADRADCIARTDVFDEFVSCQDPDDAPCNLLNAEQCDARDECAWDGESCGLPLPPTCAERAEQNDCESADCHWWADSCHDDPAPGQCDQPDPGSCEAAGCEWSDQGCHEPRMTCTELMQGPCGAREDCRWRNNRCETDPAGLVCDELSAEHCSEREDCTWQAGEGCTVRPVGECDQLVEAECLARPDCEPLYDHADPPNRDREGMEAPPAPPNEYIGCREHVLECANVPLEACDRTPGCAIVEGPDDQPVCGVEVLPCGDLTPDECRGDDRCQVNSVEICDEDGGGAPGNPGDGDEPFFPEPCRVVEVCEPRAVEDCGQIQDLEQCINAPGCAPRELDNCDCGEPVEPFPCNCEPGDEDCACLDQIIAPPCECFECVPSAPCEDLPPEECDATPGCHTEILPDCPDCDGGALICVSDEVQPPFNCDNIFDQDQCDAHRECEWSGDGFGGGAPPPDDCQCPPGVDCDCEEPAPVPPPQGFCAWREQPPLSCWDFADERACADGPDCVWHQAEGEPIPAIPCDCDPGVPDCPCFDDPGPPPGFCAPNEAENVCQDLDEAACQARPDCEGQIEGICPGCDGPGCECIEQFFCRPIQIAACWDLDEDICEDRPDCLLEWLMPPCACNPEDPDCGEIQCDPIPVCRPLLGQECADQPNENACVNMERCDWQVEIRCKPCAPGDENCVEECEEVGMCVDGNEIVPPPPPPMPVP